MKKRVVEQFLMENKLSFHKNFKIGKFLSMKVGGKVGYIIFTESNRDLTNLLIFLNSIGTDYILIGGGTNIIFPDSCTELIVIINRCSDISKESGNLLKVNSGVRNSVFLEYCKKSEISGFEFLAGIPGTLGGAAAVNAGAFGKSISEKIKGGDIFTFKGDVEYKELSFFDFEYRNSKFKYGKDIILNIYLKFDIGEKKTIRDEIERIHLLRREKHPPYSEHSAGCFFKNPLINGKKISAGKLIDDCKLRGYETKTTKISSKHSNFIVNRGTAAFSDIESLEKIIADTVKMRSGIQLEREVIFVSPEGKKY